MLQLQRRLYTNAHLVDAGLIDDRLRGSSIGSTKDLRLQEILAKL